MDISDAPPGSKVRLDTFLSTKLSSVSRARLQASIKEGMVKVNGTLQVKASYAVRPGDAVEYQVLPPPPLEAAPEALPLDIVFEDDDLIVINKSADMVMHPSPGHSSNTLVNALLHHCGLPPIRLDYTDNGLVRHQYTKGLYSDITKDYDSTEEEDGWEGRSSPEVALDGLSALHTVPVRPGIVHRLDKGTTGLVVVAKTDLAHSSLAAQFKDRSIKRTYLSITLGVPYPLQNKVETNIGRDFRDRKKMAAFAYASTRGRTAISNYIVLDDGLAAGKAALVQWRLQTGRTHQIRVHAKYLGHPLLGDDTYGGGNSAVQKAFRTSGSAFVPLAQEALALLNNRPALHAKTLGFTHPKTGETMEFDSQLPGDFAEVLAMLQLNASSP